jgi:hypothetical protein
MTIAGSAVYFATVTVVRIWRAIMSKCAEAEEHRNTHSVATRVVETVVAGLLILMMAA